MFGKQFLPLYISIRLPPEEKIFLDTNTYEKISLLYRGQREIFFYNKQKQYFTWTQYLNIQDNPTSCVRFRQRKSSVLTRGSVSRKFLVRVIYDDEMALTVTGQWLVPVIKNVPAPSRQPARQTAARIKKQMFYPGQPSKKTQVDCIHMTKRSMNHGE